ncbi:MAG: hypothetical protein Q7U14_02510, partial [Lacisediminimonas sp.]|nr:hypothetical protein [Lacisediminimonas sp.]
RNFSLGFQWLANRSCRKDKDCESPVVPGQKKRDFFRCLPESHASGKQFRRAMSLTCNSTAWPGFSYPYFVQKI